MTCFYYTHSFYICQAFSKKYFTDVEQYFLKNSALKTNESFQGSRFYLYFYAVIE